MKTHVIVGIILVLSGCFPQPQSERPSQPQNVPCAGHVIVPIENIFVAGIGTDTVGWKIEASDVSAMESSINTLFAKPDRRMKGLLEDSPKKAPFPLSDYYMQYAVARLGSSLNFQ